MPITRDSLSDAGFWSQVDVEKHTELLQAARRLDLTRLPLLRTCEMLLSYSDGQLQGFCNLHQQTVTAHIAAPHLTRLLLDGNFCDVEGLQLSRTLQELSLTGCRMPIGRLAQLVGGLPELQDVWYDGKEFVRDLDDWYADVPNIIPTRQDEAELAAALSGCTKLTTLSIVDLQDRICVPIPASEADVPGGYVPWIQHLQHLGQLQHLELEVDVSEADAQHLTALKMLTHLRTYSFDASDSFWDALQKCLTNLQVLNPCSITRIIHEW